ncbi:antibiotic biosynthesis monooxygenase [Paenibacillus sp. 481]|nr:antibiotic biosynthesis monooxygenase [Paenibacillus sp. 481]
MFVRVVHFKSKAGMEEQLRKIGRDVLVPINKDAGCEQVHFLEPTADNHSFGVISIWDNKEQLDAMKNSERYRALIQDLTPLIESITDQLYLTE